MQTPSLHPLATPGRFHTHRGVRGRGGGGGGGTLTSCSHSALKESLGDGEEGPVALLQTDGGRWLQEAGAGVQVRLLLLLPKALLQFRRLLRHAVGGRRQVGQRLCSKRWQKTAFRTGGGGRKWHLEQGVVGGNGI